RARPLPSVPLCARPLSCALLSARTLPMGLGTQVHGSFSPADGDVGKLYLQWSAPLVAKRGQKRRSTPDTQAHTYVYTHTHTHTHTHTLPLSLTHTHTYTHTLPLSLSHI